VYQVVEIQIGYYLEVIPEEGVRVCELILGDVKLLRNLEDLSRRRARLGCVKIALFTMIMLVSSIQRNCAGSQVKTEENIALENGCDVV
jgi:hypothetical protein